MTEATILGKLNELDPYLLESAIKAMNYANNSNPEVATAAWALVLKATSMKENYSNTRQLVGLICSIFGRLQDTLSNPRAQELGISSLLNLTQNSDFVEYNGERAAKAAIASMETNDSDIHVQEACVNLLERLVTRKNYSSNEKIVRLVTSTGLKLIMDTTRTYGSSNLLIREKAISTIHTVVTASRDLSSTAKAFNDADGPKLFRKLMDGAYGTKESDDSYLKCLETVAFLIKSPICAKTIFENDITANVSQKIASVKCNSEIFKAALSFLVTAVTYGGEFAKFDGFSLTEWAMKLLGRTSDQGTTKSLIRILANILAEGDSITLARFVELKGLELVTGILKSAADVDLKINCSSIVWAVSYNGDADAQKEILRLNVAKYVADTLRLAIYNKKSVDQPLGALWSLTAMQENVDLVKDADGLRLLDEALTGANYNEEWTEYLLGTLWNMAQGMANPKDKWAFPVNTIMRTMSSGRVPVNVARLALGVLANVLPHTVNDIEYFLKGYLNFVAKMMSSYPSDKYVNILCCDILSGMIKNASNPNSANLLKLISQKDLFDCIINVFSRFRSNIHMRKDAIAILQKVSRIRTASESFKGAGLNAVISELKIVSVETVGNEKAFDDECSICTYGFMIIGLLLRQPQMGVSKVLDSVGFEEVIMKALKKFHNSKRTIGKIMGMTWNYATEKPSAGNNLLVLGFCKTVFEDVLPKLDPADESDTKDCVYVLNATVAVLAQNTLYGDYMKNEYTNYIGELLGKYSKNTQIRFLLNTLLRKSNRTTSTIICSNISGGECKEPCDYKKKNGYCEKCCHSQEGYRCNSCYKVYCLYCRKSCSHVCVGKIVVQAGLANVDKFTRVFMPFICSCSDKKCKSPNSFAQQPPQKVQKISTK